MASSSLRPFISESFFMAPCPKKKRNTKISASSFKRKMGGGSSAQMSQHQSRKNESRCVFLNLFSFCCVGQIFFFPTQSGDCV